MSVSFQNTIPPHGLGDQPCPYEMRWCTSALREPFLGFPPKVAADGRGGRAVGLILFQPASLLVGESSLEKGCGFRSLIKRIYKVQAQLASEGQRDRSRLCTVRLINQLNKDFGGLVAPQEQRAALTAAPS